MQIQRPKKGLPRLPYQGPLKSFLLSRETSLCTREQLKCPGKVFLLFSEHIPPLTHYKSYSSSENRKYLYIPSEWLSRLKRTELKYVI
jgi:hypothetical protein